MPSMSSSLDPRRAGVCTGDTKTPAARLAQLLISVDRPLMQGKRGAQPSNSMMLWRVSPTRVEGRAHLDSGEIVGGVDGRVARRNPQHERQGGWGDHQQAGQESALQGAETVLTCLSYTHSRQSAAQRQMDGARAAAASVRGKAAVQKLCQRYVGMDTTCGVVGSQPDSRLCVGRSCQSKAGGVVYSGKTCSTKFDFLGPWRWYKTSRLASQI